MRFVLFAAVVAEILASSNPTHRICIIMPDHPISSYPPIGSLHAFMVHESVDRLVDPERMFVTFPPHLSSCQHLQLLAWKDLSSDAFLEGALPHLGYALEIAMKGPEGERNMLQGIVASFDSEEGEEIRREYCLSFQRSLKAIPESVWAAIPPPYSRK